MRPYDAVFLAVVAGFLIERPRVWWLAVFAPLISVVAHAMLVSRLAIPMAALVAVLLVPRFAPVAILLAVPIYRGPWEVVQTMLLWLVVSALMEGLEDRFVDETRSSRMRAMSARFLSAVVLYYTLLPVTFL